MPDQAARELSAAADKMSDQMAELRKHLTLSQKQVRNLKIVTWLSVFFTIVAIGVGGLGLYLVTEIKHTQVKACQNQNETREANRILWGFIVDLSLASNPDRTQKERQQLEDIRTWVNDLYAERDCSQLDKEYPLPKPPPILKKD